MIALIPLPTAWFSHALLGGLEGCKPSKKHSSGRAGVAGTTVTVNLIEPGTLFGDRINQFDMRFAKILRFGRTRANVGVDLYNVANAAPVLSYNQTFVANGAWLAPTSVLQPRFVKFSAQIDF